MIKKALRDEGTSYHYLPPKRFAKASPDYATKRITTIFLNGQAVDHIKRTVVKEGAVIALSGAARRVWLAPSCGAAAITPPGIGRFPGFPRLYCGNYFFGGSVLQAAGTERHDKPPVPDCYPNALLMGLYNYG